MAEHPDEYLFKGRFFLFRGWPKRCTAVFTNGILEFGTGNWSIDVHVDTLTKEIGPLTDRQLLAIIRNVKNVNSHVNFITWLEHEDEDLQALWDIEEDRNAP
jgi:hypothetical protein